MELNKIMGSNILLAAILFFQGNVLAQTDSTKTSVTNNSESHNFYLVNSADSTKKIKLSTKSELSVKYTLKTTEKKETDHLQYFEGTLINMNGETATFLMTGDYSKKTNKLGGEEMKNTRYYDEDNTGIYRTIDIASIESISYARPYKNTMNIIGGVFVLIGSNVALLVAPLVSIKFKDGSFNSKRYFATAGGGLGGMVLGFTMLGMSGSKTYEIITNDVEESGSYHLKMVKKK
jgi:hypothetical protein